MYRHWLPVSSIVLAAAIGIAACGGGASGLDAFANTPLVTNLPPLVTGAPPPDATVGIAYLYQIVAEDPDGDALAYGLEAAPAGMIITPEGALSWIPDASQIGDHAISLTVSDGQVAVTSGWIITVAAGSSNWVIETIQAPTDGRWNSIALDGNGAAHVAYHTATTGLGYATNMTGNWIPQDIDSIPADVTGQHTSMAFDSAGALHIAYYNFTKKDLRYATNASGGWTMETVDSANRVGRSASLVLDTSDHVHIVYFDYDAEILKYATNVSGGWAFETIDTTGVGGNTVMSYCSIVLDAANRPHVAYYNHIDMDIKYATNAPGAWVIEPADQTAEVSNRVSIALNANGDAHIAYYDNANSDLKLARRVAGNWTAETVDAAGTVGLHVSLRLSAVGEPRIAYFDRTNDLLKYAAHESGGWSIEIVDQALADDVGMYASLALDSAGAAHIVYKDRLIGGLKYARQN